jgi:hypothetical protein
MNYQFVNSDVHESKVQWDVVMKRSTLSSATAKLVCPENLGEM